MLQFLIISIFFSFVLAEPPYPSRGYRPTGPAFQLPNRINTQFWQAENQYASPRNVYGAPNNAYDAHTAPGFQKPYSTINLPPNQYGIPSESTNSLQNQYGAPLNIKPNQNNQYQAPSSLTNSNRNQFNLMQQQLPGTNGARFYTRTNQNQYSKAIRNSPQAEVIRSIDISPQISLETQNQYQAQTNTNNQAANQFPPQSNAGYPQQPQLNYGSPDNIGNTQGGSNDIDVRAGDNEQTDNNVNLSFDANDQDNQGRDGDNDFGSGFGSTNQDGFYIPPKPTIRPAREPSEPIEPEVTTTPESTDYVSISSYNLK